MALTNLFNRASKLEASLKHLRLQKAEEEREAWRQANCERLQWEMFLRNHGPESVEVTEEDLEKTSDPEGKDEIKAELAFKKLCQQVLSHYDGWVVKYANMNETEKAIAWLLESLYAYRDIEDLFKMDLDTWACKLNLGPELGFVEEIKAIDAYVGNTDWREVCYLQKNQDAMMERAFEYEEDRRARYLRYKAEHPEDED